MNDLKSGNKVYCPALSVKPFLTYTKKDINGVFIKYRGKEYWFTVNGLPDLSMQISNYDFKSIPSLFLGTEENRLRLCDLYDMDFLDDFNIPVYAINVSRDGFGHASNDWIFWSQEGYYDWHSPGDKECPTVDDFLWFDIKVSPHTEVLKELIESGKLTPHHVHYTIICIGHRSINKPLNKDYYATSLD